MKKILYTTLLALTSLLLFTTCEELPLPEKLIINSSPEMLVEYSINSFPTKSDTWVITDTTATTEDFAGLSAVIEYISENEPERQITLEFPNLEAIPAYAIFGKSSASTSDFALGALVGITAPKATSIGESAFTRCDSLTSVDFPQVTEIGDNAFSNCSSLTSVDFPLVTDIGEYAFSQCDSLTSVDFPLVTDIGDYTFWDCRGLTSVDLPQVTEIGEGAFLYCIGLTSVDFPLVTTISRSAFWDCRGLTSVDFPQVTEIGEGAFWSCDVLTTMSLATGSGVKLSSVDSDAFQFTTTTNITLTVGSSNSSYVSGSTLTVGDFRAEFKEILIDDVAQEEAPTFLSEYSTTRYPTATDTWVIEDATATTEDFAGLSAAIEYVTNNETSRQITLEFSNLESIPAYAIFGESSASDTFASGAVVGVVASKATSIGVEAFAYCTKLASVTFSEVTSVGSSAFAYCTSLADVSLATNSEVKLSSVDSDSFISTATIVITLNLGSANSDYVSGSILTVGDFSAEFKEIYLDGVLQEEQVIVPDGMVYVKGGTFQMGSDDISGATPVHSVTLSSFCIGKYEVTQAEWEAVMGSVPDYMNGYMISDNYPVGATWYSCVGFCNAKSVADGLEECYEIDGTTVTLLSGKNGYRLPTEAEWEYAARGGNQSQGYSYAGSNTIDDVAWYSGNASSTLHNVGTKQPNELGIYDMSGNVTEWCWDWSGSYDSIPQTNPTGASSGIFRIGRGGSIGYSTGSCYSSSRNGTDPSFPNFDWGLRLVCCP